MVKIKIDSLANEISNLMKEYTSDVEKGVKEAKEKVAKVAVERLKATSPKRRPKYANAWKTKEVGGAIVVYNTHGQLTHLLEKGHALRRGGRTRAFVHIAPVEQMVIDDFEKAVVKVIENG